jgi:hypothetical protein
VTLGKRTVIKVQPLLIKKSGHEKADAYASQVYVPEKDGLVAVYQVWGVAGPVLAEQLREELAELEVIVATGTLGEGQPAATRLPPQLWRGLG